MTIKHNIDAAIFNLDITEEQRDEYARRCSEAYAAAGLPVSVEIRSEYGWPMFEDDYATENSDIVIDSARTIADRILEEVAQ